MEIDPLQPHPASRSSVCAVVVTHNRLALLQECLAALRLQSRALEAILVIDNQSTDGTAPWLLAQGDVCSITQPNSGAAGGFRRGIQEACSKGFTAVWVMDDDCIATPGALQALCEAWSRVPEAGFFSSRIVGTQGVPLNVPILDFRPLANGSPRWSERLADGLLGVRFASFVSVLIPAREVRAHGLPFAELFIWGEDTEYTTRLSRSRPSFLVTASEVVHKTAIQRRMSIACEEDLRRIRLFVFYYRNLLFVALRYRDFRLFLHCILKAVTDSMEALATPHGFLKVRMILEGTLAGFFFRVR